MTRAALTTALAAAVALTLAAPASADDRRTATKILRGTMWTSYQSGSVTGATQDRVAHLCSDGTFVIVTSFVSTYVEGADSSSYDHPYGESRVTGRWRVLSARLTSNRRYGRARVGYVTSQGERGVVVFTAGPRGTTMAGAPAEVGRSTVCS